MQVVIDTSAVKVIKAGTATYIDCLTNKLEEKSDLKIKQVAYQPLFSRKIRMLRMIDTFFRDICWLQFLLPKISVKFGADLLHCPAIFAPARISIPFVVTIHDLYILENKNAFPMWHRNYLSKMLPKIVKNARKIIAISHFTKKEILRYFPNVNKNRIEVTHLAADTTFCSCRDDEQEKFRLKYLLQKPFILSVATLEPRKNIFTMIDAYASIKERIDHDLVIVGTYGWSMRALGDAVRKENLEQRVRFLGYLSQDDLINAYNTADFFIYISLYEGFGLPPLEAMSCGCPVVVSNIDSLSEVVGNAGMKINPYNTKEVAYGMLKMASDKTLRNEYENAGLERAALFSWDRCQRETIEIYKSAVKY